jgi:hypothetical protein
LDLDTDRYSALNTGSGSISESNEYRSETLTDSSKIPSRRPKDRYISIFDPKFIFLNCKIFKYFVIKNLEWVGIQIRIGGSGFIENPADPMNMAPQHWCINLYRYILKVLRYFFVSYVKILRFYLQKIFLIGPLLGEVRFFRVVLGLRGMKKNFELGQNFFFFLHLWTLNMTQY